MQRKTKQQQIEEMWAERERLDKKDPYVIEQMWREHERNPYRGLTVEQIKLVEERVEALIRERQGATRTAN